MHNLSSENKVVYEYSEVKQIQLFGNKKTSFAGKIVLVRDCVLDTQSNRILGKNFIYDYVSHKFLTNSEDVSTSDCEILETAGLIVCSNYSNYFHWIMEALYSVWLLKRLNINNLIGQNFLYPQIFHKHSLEIFGVKIKYGGIYKIKELFVPEFYIHPEGEFPNNLWQYVGYSKNFYIFLNEIFDSNRFEFGNSNKIYLNRSNASFRKIEDPKLESLMLELGYVPRDFIAETISDQAQQIKSASRVIAIHGAANTNFIFANPGATLTELFASNYAPSNFEIIASDIGCTYQKFLCEPCGDLNAPLKSNLHVDTKIFKSLAVE